MEVLDIFCRKDGIESGDSTIDKIFDYLDVSNRYDFIARIVYTITTNGKANTMSCRFLVGLLQRCVHKLLFYYDKSVVVQ